MLTYVIDYLTNLIQCTNLNNEYNPLVNMGVIQYQFELIHSFYDRNGKTSNVINVLYIVMNEKILYPILYLNRYIIRNKV